MVSCILCSCVTIDTFLGISPGEILHLLCVILTNQWIVHNLSIDLIIKQALSVVIYITSFYMGAYIKNLQSIQQTM